MSLEPTADSSYITIKLTPNQVSVLFQLAAIMEETYIEYMDESIGTPLSQTDLNSLHIALNRLSKGMAVWQEKVGA